MEIAKNIQDEAYSMLVRLNQSENMLPQQISCAPEFWLANADDSSIHAFATITFSGNVYKIGTKNS